MAAKRTIRKRVREDGDPVASPPPPPATGGSDAPSADAEGTWLMPFTDIVTLLLVFFVIFVLMREPPDPEGATPGALDGMPGVMREGTTPEAGDVATRARGYVDSRGLGEAVDVRRTEGGVRLRLTQPVLFESGAAEVQPQGARLLDRLVPLLQRTPGAVAVEGHTDDRPVRGRYPSNWALSAARAASVVARFAEAGIAGERLHAVGRGASEPLADNDTAAGRRQNRRVEVFLHPGAEARGVPQWPPSLRQ